MKLLLLLTLVAVATAAVAPQYDFSKDAALVAKDGTLDPRNFVINQLVNQLFNYLRRVINNGAPMFGIPPLDPLKLEHFHLNLPGGLINLDLEIIEGVATGFGGFVVNRGVFRPSDLTFDVDITVPSINIEAKRYKLEGDLFSAIPLYGDGRAHFVVKGFRMSGLLHLKQSEDGKSVLLDYIERPFYEIPSIKSGLTGVIGGGNIDAIVNAIVEDVIVGYANRFHGGIAYLASVAIEQTFNPYLNQLDTWKFIELAPLLNEIPSLDPFKLDHAHLKVPAGLINLDLEILEGVVTGLTGLVVNRGVVQLSNLTIDVDISIPNIQIEAKNYKLVGDLYSAFPLYGDGQASFVVNGFRMSGLLHLKQSDDGKSVLLDYIERPYYEIPSVKSGLTGVIGGGNIDAIVNAIVEDVIVDYANRFHGGIAYLASVAIEQTFNPYLDQLDTWKYISRFV